MGPISGSELECTTYDEDGAGIDRTQLSEAAGGDEIGCSRYALPGSTVVARSLPRAERGGD